MNDSSGRRASHLPSGNRLGLGVCLCAGLWACGNDDLQPAASSAPAARQAAGGGAAARGPVESRELTLLHPGDDARQPIVMFSGIGGGAEVFTPLAESLPEWQAFYAAPAHAGVEGEALSVEDVASAYEAAVRRLSERGPIVLGGYSFGMLIAYELALRLREAGKPVARLVGLDAFAPGYPRKLEGLDWARAHLEELTASDERRSAYLDERLGRLRSWLPFAAKAAADDGETGEAAAPADPMDALWVTLQRASHTYVPASTENAPMLLFVADEPFHWVATDTDDPMRGWAPHIEGAIETRSLQGTHLDVFEPRNAEALTRGVREVLYGLRTLEKL